ncbi:MAG: SDR family NAD(P)-dependent oxidoreductase [Anaerolineales bacterium]
MHGVWLVTGATGGLGKAFAVEGARRGWDLILTDLDDARLALLAAGLERAYGVEVRWHRADLTREESRAKLVNWIRGERLRVRGLINVAGLDHEGPFMERDSVEIMGILRLNIESTLMMIHALLALRDHASTFRIINVSSLGAYFSMPIKATYAASKRFLLDFSLALRNELRDEDVSVTVLCPAGMPTNDACIDAIAAQGLMGQLTTQNVGCVAHETLEAALRGRAIVIPGFLNRMILGLGSLVPAPSVADMVGTRWRASQQRRSRA